MATLVASVISPSSGRKFESELEVNSNEVNLLIFMDKEHKIQAQDAYCPLWKMESIDYITDVEDTLNKYKGKDIKTIGLVHHGSRYCKSGSYPNTNPRLMFYDNFHEMLLSRYLPPILELGIELIQDIPIAELPLPLDSEEYIEQQQKLDILHDYKTELLKDKYWRTTNKHKFLIEIEPRLYKSKFYTHIEYLGDGKYKLDSDNFPKQLCSKDYVEFIQVSLFKRLKLEFDNKLLKIVELKYRKSKLGVGDELDDEINKENENIVTYLKENEKDIASNQMTLTNFINQVSINVYLDILINSISVGGTYISIACDEADSEKKSDQIVKMATKKMTFYFNTNTVLLTRALNLEKYGTKGRFGGFFKINLSTKKYDETKKQYIPFDKRGWVEKITDGGNIISSKDTLKDIQLNNFSGESSFMQIPLSKYDNDATNYIMMYYSEGYYKALIRIKEGKEGCERYRETIRTKYNLKKWVK